jgi:hypothetical protein
MKLLYTHSHWKIIEVQKNCPWLKRIQMYTLNHHQKIRPSVVQSKRVYRHVNKKKSVNDVEVENVERIKKKIDSPLRPNGGIK